MSDAKICPACGAKTVKYAHTLSIGLVRGFYKAVKLAAQGDTILFSDLGTVLTINEATNFHKLRYWGVIEKRGESTVKGGEWVVTDLGFDFLAGRTKLPPKVWTYRKVVKAFEGEPKGIEEITGGYKYRPEYAQEAEPHDPSRLI